MREVEVPPLDIVGSRTFSRAEIWRSISFRKSWCRLRCRKRCCRLRRCKRCCRLRCCKRCRRQRRRKRWNWRLWRFGQWNDNAFTKFWSSPRTHFLITLTLSIDIKISNLKTQIWFAKMFIYKISLDHLVWRTRLGDAKYVDIKKIQNWKISRTFLLVNIRSKLISNVIKTKM